ncbi:MAG: transposase [Pseudonocardiaceae bacterium]
MTGVWLVEDVHSRVSPRTGVGLWSRGGFSRSCRHPLWLPLTVSGGHPVATRRRFTQEYKDQAVSLILDSGRTGAEVAKSIGIHEMTLGSGVRKVKESGPIQDKDLAETERFELERLRKENATLRRERNSAKK